MEEIIELVEGGRIRRSSLLAKIATYLYCETANNTSTGAWCVDFEEVVETFSVPKELFTAEFVEDIIHTLITDFGKQVAECWVNIEDPDNPNFDITLYYDYIPGYVDEDASLINEDDDEWN